MEDKYSKNLVKDHKYWSIYVAENQGYLGRCVVWCKREDALDIADATQEEQRELFIVLKDLLVASKHVFHPDWFNYAFLGNETRHLHCHFIPRYESPRIFMGIKFEDKLYGNNYKTDHSFITSQKLLQAVRDELKKSLE
jgi:diadenosine tetraphosphate (Ap4A) HIT family hydrolase